MLAIFTPQGEDEFVSSMLARESENTRIDEYQSVFQLEDQCQIHLRSGVAHELVRSRSLATIWTACVCEIFTARSPVTTK